jgi:hypothetical protein
MRTPVPATMPPEADGKPDLYGTIHSTTAAMPVGRSAATRLPQTAKRKAILSHAVRERGEFWTGEPCGTRVAAGKTW